MWLSSMSTSVVKSPCATAITSSATFALVMAHPLRAASTFHVCTLWTLALANIKGQAQCAAIICPCVVKRQGSGWGWGWGWVENTLAEGFSFLKKSTRSVATGYIIQWVDCAAGFFIGVSQQNGASPAGTREAPQVWQRRWDHGRPVSAERMPKQSIKQTEQQAFC